MANVSAGNTGGEASATFFFQSFINLCRALTSPLSGGMSCEVPVTCRTVLGQSLGWGGFGGGDDPLRNPASGTFDGSSTAADVTKGLDLRGRCYVMTGGTGQLGREVARALVRKGAHVVIAARSMARGSALAEELKRLDVAKGGDDHADAAPSSPSSAPSPDSTSPHASASPVTTNDATLAAAGDATVMLCDLASQDSVRAFAQSFRRKALPLHGVLCCAGVILQVRVSLYFRTARAIRLTAPRFVHSRTNLPQRNAKSISR